MKLIIEIPQAFVSHFYGDRFQDSLSRVVADIDLNIKSGRCGSSGNYEKETIEMLKKAMGNAVNFDEYYRKMKNYQRMLGYSDGLIEGIVASVVGEEYDEETDERSAKNEADS